LDGGNTGRCRWGEMGSKRWVLTTSKKQVCLHDCRKACDRPEWETSRFGGRAERGGEWWPEIDARSSD
jgi:hypothetical protein